MSAKLTSKHPPEDEAVHNPDDIINELGGCGNFQIRMAIIVHVIKTIVNWATISMVFLTAVPEWRCSDHGYFNTSTNENSTRSNNISLEKSCVNLKGEKCLSFEFNEDMHTVVSEWSLICEQEWIPSMLVTLTLAATITGYILAGHLADAFGRRYPFYLSILLISVFSLISYFSVSWVMFAVNRIIIGIGSAFFLTIQYSYLSEFTQARWRSWFIGFPSWPMQGCLLALVLWLVKDWRKMQLVIAAVGVPFLATIVCMPESFRWYYSHDRVNDAEKVITKVSKLNRRPVPDMTFIEKQLAKRSSDKDKKYSVLDLFKSRFLIKVTLLLLVTCSMKIQIPSMFINGVTITPSANAIKVAFRKIALSLSDVGITFAIPQLPGDIYFNLFLIHAVQIPAKAIGIGLANRFGRRNTSILIYITNSLSCFAVAIVQYIDTGIRDQLTIGFAAVANLAMAATWGPLQTITVEVYPTVIRNIGFSFCAIIGHVGAAAAPPIVHLDNYIPGIIYFVMGGLCFVGAIALFWIPETKDKNLTDTLKETTQA